MKRYAKWVVGFLALAIVVWLVADRGSRTETAGGGGAVGSDGTVVVGAPDIVPVPPGPAMGGGMFDATKDGAITASTGSTLYLPTGPSIIKYGDISVVIEVGTFDASFQDVSAIAGRYGGFVLGSTVSGGDRRSGYLTIRVRSAEFDRAMADLRKLGDVESESVSGQDVSMQVVDLEARLASWKAQREVLLKLMDQAKTVGDTLKVQTELQNVQMNIEQIQGELTYLQDQVDLSTINVAIREPGANEGIPDRPRIGDAWSKAVDAFLSVIVAMIVGLGYLVPIAVVLAAAAWAWRTIRRRRSA
jgi:hypothetical protein